MEGGSKQHVLLSSLQQSESLRLCPVEKVNEALVAGATHRFDLSAVLVHLEGGHGLDAGSLRRFRVRINVDLLEDELGVLGHLAGVDGSDALARRAPGRREVDNEGLASLGRCDCCVEGSLVCEHHVTVVSHIYYFCWLVG